MSYTYTEIIDTDRTTRFNAPFNSLVVVNAGVTVDVTVPASAPFAALSATTTRSDSGGFDIAGTVKTDWGTAISIAGSEAEVAEIYIRSTGQILGYQGLYTSVYGTEISNYGNIDTRQYAVSLDGEGSSFTNWNKVRAWTSAVVADQEDAVIRNHGTISAQYSALTVTGALADIENRGTITAYMGGITLGGSYASVTNWGSITAFMAVIVDDRFASFTNEGGGVITNTMAHGGTFHLTTRATDAEIINYGIIRGFEGGMAIWSAGEGLTIRNAGTIDGTIVLDGTNRFDGTVPDLFLTNSGSITGAITLRHAADRIINTGSLASVDLGGGDDFFDTTGGTVSGIVKGGWGDDVFVVSSAVTLQEEAYYGGTDLVKASLSWTLGDYFENLTLLGEGNIDATGNGLANILTGNDGNNTLSGGAGDDTLIGGRGDDVYLIEAGDEADVIRENVGEGNDSVRSAITFSLAGLTTVENLALTGSAAIDATGNALDNVLWGNSGANSLAGGDGNDTLSGGAGVDSLAGGRGDDVYIIGAVGDEADVVRENAGEGNDTVRSSISFSLAGLAAVENIRLTGLADIGATGNALDNVLIGNQAANILSGGDGNDTLIGNEGGDTLLGGRGDDQYYVDGLSDIVLETPGAGSDTVYSTVSLALGENVENLVLQGAAEKATGNAVANKLTGNDAGNEITGRAGRDTLVGGRGNDIYTITATGDDADVIVEKAAEGTDTVRSAISYSLAALAAVENLTLTGASTTNATGNALDNVLTGNDAANILSGGAGKDTLIGGRGNDSYYVDNVSDLVREASGAGTDTVYSTVSLTLADNVERLVLQAKAGTAIGNALVNILTGNAYANLLDGRAGADRMVGGAGNDTYIVDNARDSVREKAGEGTDLVKSSVGFTLGDNLEHLLLTGTSAIAGTGNALSNSITGNAGANILKGEGGADRLNGGSGADVLYGGSRNDLLIGGAGADRLSGNSGADTFVFSAASGHDTITDFSTVSDVIDLSAISEITSFSDLKAQHLSDAGSYLLLTWNSGANSLKIAGIASVKELSAGDFIFA
ncbi:hypothetical protein IB238_01830 [Rhizobium sp. ARZ01]|uniref:calcium-binding protein n=1 Tax=Rhizobium sp. ARZ01 TaxID=2769313 RepID=UPI0017869083|nr:calcium-binding protein [Rhizobium sp. ARZ01]MBD9371378.1 hypothetical protein [Rhizobium sp. ARZ01]